MYVCVYIYAHTYLHTYVHTYIHTYIHTYRHTRRIKLPKTPQVNEQTRSRAQTDNGFPDPQRALDVDAELRLRNDIEKLTLRPETAPTKHDGKRSGCAHMQNNPKREARKNPCVQAAGLQFRNHTLQCGIETYTYIR